MSTAIHNFATAQRVLSDATREFQKVIFGAMVVSEVIFTKHPRQSVGLCSGTRGKYAESKCRWCSCASPTPTRFYIKFDLF